MRLLLVRSLEIDNLKMFSNPVHQSIHLINKTGEALCKVELISEEGKTVEAKLISTSTFGWQVLIYQQEFIFLKGKAGRRR